MTLPIAAPARDDLATLAAIGVLAYVSETLVHEAMGHGLACLGRVGLSVLAAAEPATAVHPVVTVARSGRWILAGALAALVLVAIVGPGRFLLQPIPH